jgi:hypothetical protein
LALLLKVDHLDAIACNCFLVDFDFESIAGATEVLGLWIVLSKDNLPTGNAGRGSSVMKQVAIFWNSNAAKGFSLCIIPKRLCRDF